MTPPSDSNGFSLVEVLITLVIISFLAVLTSEGIRQALLIRDRITSDALGLDESASLRRALNRTLESAAPPNSEGERRSFSFLGAPQALNFTAPLPESTFRGALARYGLALTADGTLALTWTVDAKTIDGREDATVTSLLKKVSAMSIEYFGPVSETDSAWRSEWRRLSLPQLVRIRWTRQGEVTEFVLRPATARIDCAPGAAPFVRACFE